MHHGAKRISSTLHGLVNYARPGPLVLGKISLHRLLEDTLAFLEHQPMLRGKQLENTVPRDLPHIRADANQLSQVLMNLLLNAAEATPEGGRISITASKLTWLAGYVRWLGLEFPLGPHTNVPRP